MLRSSAPSGFSAFAKADRLGSAHVAVPVREFGASHRIPASVEGDLASRISRAAGWPLFFAAAWLLLTLIIN
jgi:hypothetical protein